MEGRSNFGILMNILLGRAPPSFHLWVTEVTVMNTSNGNFEGYHLFIKHMEGEIHEKENSCSPCKCGTDARVSADLVAMFETLRSSMIRCVWYMRH